MAGVAVRVSGTRTAVATVASRVGTMGTLGRSARTPTLQSIPENIEASEEKGLTRRGMGLGRSEAGLASRRARSN